MHTGCVRKILIIDGSAGWKNRLKEILHKNFPSCGTRVANDVRHAQGEIQSYDPDGVIVEGESCLSLLKTMGGMEARPTLVHGSREVIFENGEEIDLSKIMKIFPLASFHLKHMGEAETYVSAWIEAYVL